MGAGERRLKLRIKKHARCVVVDRTAMTVCTLVAGDQVVRCNVFVHGTFHTRESPGYLDEVVALHAPRFPSEWARKSGAASLTASDILPLGAWLGFSIALLPGDVYPDSFELGRPPDTQLVSYMAAGQLRWPLQI